MTDLKMVDAELILAQWLLENYFVPGSVYNYSQVGVGSKVYVRVHTAISVDQILRHLRGEISVAAPSAHNNMVVNISVDIDSLNMTAVALARDTLKSHGFPAVISFSGGKGYHLTIFLSKPTPLAVVQPVSRRIQDELNRVGVTYCKISPSANGSGGDCMAIPLGLHPETGKRCCFLDDNLNPVDDPLAFVQAIPKIDLNAGGHPLVEVDRETGEIKTVYPKIISKKPCINKLWQEGLQAPHTRHSATMVIANSVKRSNLIPPNQKQDAVIDWVSRIFEKSKRQGYISPDTDLPYAISEAQRLLKEYDRTGTFGELCSNELFKNAMRSACVDEYRCKLGQNHGSADYRLMRRLGIFAAPNATPKGLGKSAMAIYEAIEDIVEDYPVFDWNGQQAFTLSIQELVGLSSCSRATVINQRKKLLEVGLLVKIPKGSIPANIRIKHPPYVEYYYLPKIDEGLITTILNKLREGV